MARPIAHPRNDRRLNSDARLALVFGLTTLIGVGLVSRYALLTVLYEGLRAMMILVPPALAGLWLVSLLGSGRWPMRWQLLLGAALGIGFTSLLVLVCGLAGWLDRYLVVGFLVGCSIFGLLRFRTLIETRPSGDEASTPSDLGRFRLLWFLAVPFLVMALVAASNPPGMIWAEEGFGYDVLEYHLQVPKEYAQAGRIQYLEHNVYANFPSNVEMLYLLPMIVFDESVEAGVTANFIHLILGVLCVAAAWVVGRDWSPLAGLVSALVLGTTGWLVYLSGLAYVESGMLLFSMAAVGLILRSARSQDSRNEGESKETRSGLAPILVAGLCAGFACGCKYTAVPMFAVPVAIGVAIAHGPAIKQWLPRVLAFCLGVALTFGPWLVKNQAMTGNPVFPLANNLFGAAPPGWGDLEAQRFSAGHTVKPDDDDLTTRLSSAWRFMPGDHYQRFGPALFLLALGGLLIRRLDRRDLLLGFLLIAQLVVWIFFTHLFARFIVVSLIPLSLLAGRGSLSGGPAGRGVALAVVLILGAGWNLRFALANYLPEGTEPVPASLFYEGTIPGYEYLGVANTELGPDAKLLLVGDAKPFYFQIPVDYCVVFNRNPLAEFIESGASDAGIIEWFKDRGYTHILVNWTEVTRLQKTYGLSELISPVLFQRLERVGLVVERTFADGADRVFAVLYRVP